MAYSLLSPKDDWTAIIMDIAWRPTPNLNPLAGMLFWMSWIVLAILGVSRFAHTRRAKLWEEVYV